MKITAQKQLYRDPEEERFFAKPEAERKRITIHVEERIQTKSPPPRA